MLSARHCLSLCVATCFDHTVSPISAKCLKNNVWTADKSKMLHLLGFTENEKDPRAADSVMQSSVTGGVAERKCTV